MIDPFWSDARSQMLLDPKALSRPYVERKRVEALVTDHVTGRANHTLEIHKLLTLEHVHRLFVDAQPTRLDVRPTAGAFVHA